MNENTQLAASSQTERISQMKFSTEQVQLIKNTIAKGATNDELSLFKNIAERTGLDPFARQIFFIKRWDAAAGCEVGQPQTSIDGYRLIAERTGNYCPGDEATFIEKDGFIVNATAYVKKFVRGEWHTISATAYFNEYAQKKKDGSLTQMWNKMPHVMIAKCAEALALRKAFPAELSGLYTREEMMQADETGEPTAVYEAKLLTEKQAAFEAQAPNNYPTSDDLPDTKKNEGISKLTAKAINAKFTKLQELGVSPIELKAELAAIVGSEISVKDLTEAEALDYLGALSEWVTQIENNIPVASEAAA